ncbi:MAG TPA: prolipoprotein diacylglyceryl transferase family protein [Anaerolineales bacterium]|nr:prolipoprotein diacylglyceryl transferase family protein [Anaerolineales bacterium]
MSIFSLLLGLGALAGLGMVAWRAPKKLTARYVDAGLGILLSALVSSRLVYALTNWAYFQSHPGEIFQVWLGGLSAPGAVLGALFGLVFLRVIQAFFIGPLADGLLPLLGTLSMAAWLGCWSDGNAYGAPSTAWYALPGIDEWGTLVQRVPVQLIGAVLTLALFATLEQVRGALRRPGLAASLGLLGWGLVLFGLSFLRADPAQIWLGLRLEAWGGAAVAGVGLVGAVAAGYRQERSAGEQT